MTKSYKYAVTAACVPLLRDRRDRTSRGAGALGGQESLRLLACDRCRVHPAEVCLKNGIILKTGEGLVCPVDENGNFTAVVTEHRLRAPFGSTEGDTHKSRHLFLKKQ